MKYDLICRTCKGKRFLRRSTGYSARREQSEETYECRRCQEWITIYYSESWAKLPKYKRKLYRGKGK